MQSSLSLDKLYRESLPQEQAKACISEYLLPLKGLFLYLLNRASIAHFSIIRVESHIPNIICSAVCKVQDLLAVQTLSSSCSDRAGWCEASNVAPLVATEIMAGQLVDSLFGLMSSWDEGNLGSIRQAGQVTDLDELYVRSYGKAASRPLWLERSCEAITIVTGSII